MIIVKCADLDWLERDEGMRSVLRWQERASVENWAKAAHERLHTTVEIVLVNEQPSLWALLVPGQTARMLVASERRPWFGRFTFQPGRKVHEGLASDGRLVRSSTEEYRKVSEWCEANSTFLTPDWALAQRPRSFYVVDHPDPSPEQEWENPTPGTLLSLLDSLLRLGPHLVGQLLMFPDPAVPCRRLDLIEAYMLLSLNTFRQVFEADPLHMWGVPLSVPSAAFRVFKPWHVNPRAWAMLELPQGIWLLDLTVDLQPCGQPYVDAVYNEHWQEVQALRQRYQALEFERLPLKEAARSIFGTAAQRERYAEVEEASQQAWLNVGRVTRAYRLPILDALGIRWAGGEWKTGW